MKSLTAAVLLIATAAVAVLLRHRAWTAVAHAVAAACLLGTLLAYWFGNRPVNAKVAHWTAATLPANWPAYRDTWETAHAISSVLAAVATVVLLVATVWAMPTSDNGRRPAPFTKRRQPTTFRRQVPLLTPGNDANDIQGPWR
jgi:branched-subunit amino acid ABC-type transport system permease component